MFLVLLIACGPKHLHPPIQTDPVVQLSRARSEAPPPPQIARFTIRIETADGVLSALGTGIYSAPNRFRVELRGPIGPVQLVAACDGERVTAYILGKHTAYVGDDAEAAVRRWTGGAAGVDAVVLLLLGRLPDLGPPTTMEPVPTWTRPDGSVVRAVLDDGSGHLARIDVVDPRGVLALSARFTPGTFPSHLDIDLPALHASASVDYSDWQTGAPPETAFSVVVPPGATIHSIDTIGRPADAPPTGPAELPIQ